MLGRYDEEPTRAPVTPSLQLPHSRARFGGLALSVIVHGLLIGLLVAHGERLWSRTHASGDPALKNGGRSAGGGGGNRVAYITLPSLPEPAAVPPPVPAPRRVVVPVPEPVPDKAPPPESVDTAAVATESAAATVGENGAGVATGRGAGDSGGLGRGPGTGAGTDSGPAGNGGGARPPEPRDMAFPFDTPPKELRGMSLSVTFWVRVDGRVERYEVEPAIKDRDYAKKFDEVMRAFRFTPARAPDGTRVAGTTKISFTLPGKSSS